MRHEPHEASRKARSCADDEAQPPQPPGYGLPRVPRHRVPIPDFKLAWEALAECHASFGRQNNPLSLRLLGPTGVGKSFVFEEYLAAHPPVETPDGTQIPVVLFTTPSTPTKAGVYKAFLRGYGLHNSRGTAEDLRDRVVILANQCRTQFFLIDEAQHFVERGSAQTRTASSEALKELIASTGRPAAFAGALRAARLFDHNAQLRSRVQWEIRLSPFNANDRLQELRGFLRALYADCGEVVAAWISSHEVATRVFFATDGLHRQIAVMHQCLGALMRAESITQLTFAHLQGYFARYVHPRTTHSTNPFCREFEMRRLNGPGEPFEPTELDGDNHGDSYVAVADAPRGQQARMATLRGSAKHPGASNTGAAV